MMLSRTAESLYWLARYVERSENLARIVLAGHRMASQAAPLGGTGSEWRSTLLTAGCEGAFLEAHGDVTPERVISYLVSDPDSPFSILTCIENARQNARAVRPALTHDMWNALNESWLQARALPASTFSPDNLPEFLEWVRGRSLLFTGAYANTMLRQDAYYFTRLGSFLERADSTARILDVKYHVLLPANDGVGGVLDYQQWRSILHSVSALRSYHWIFHQRLKPWLIAELLILRPEMPRSLRSCFEQITLTLEALADIYGGERGECHRLAGHTHAQLRFGRIDDIFQRGLHEFLSEFLKTGVRLGDEIAAFYLH